MEALSNIELKSFNSFNVSAKAILYFPVFSLNQLYSSIILKTHSSWFVLGGGTNILIINNLQKVLHMKTKGKEIIKENKKHVWVEVQAGELWHDFVIWSVNKGFGGIENLALIPGTVGAAPVQNIGAYGIEQKELFESCTYYDFSEKKENRLSLNDMNFSYRSSIFKSDLKNKGVITKVIYKLHKKDFYTPNIEYFSLSSFFKKKRT